MGRKRSRVFRRAASIPLAVALVICFTPPVVSAQAFFSDPPRDSFGPDLFQSLHRPTTPIAASRLVTRVPTRDRVVFITIDDGWVRDWRVVKLVRRWHVPLTVFLVQDASARSALKYWEALARAGARIEDHTVHHPFLARFTYPQQKREICAPLRWYGRWFARAPTLFRPPYGSFGPSTLNAAGACGLRTVVMWSAEMRGNSMWPHPTSLRPGDIILMHFRHELYSELTHLLKNLRQRGLRPALLENYI